MASPARVLAAFLACSAGSHAATIKGTVLDHFTGRALARAEVRLTPSSGDVSQAKPIFAGMAGDFEFENIRPGHYLLSARRRGFATAWYGQKRWNSAAVPLAIADEKDELNLPLYLRRLGSISGTIWDENQIGIGGIKVLAYRAGRPPKFVAETQTDDRGYYRIGELAPGTYFIRSAADRLPGGDGMLPTFFKDASEYDRAWPVEVEIEQEAADRNFRPELGELYELSGEIAFPRAAVSLELVSAVERVQTRSTDDGHFVFRNVAPGDYELFASADITSRGGTERFSAYRTVTIENRDEQIRLGLESLSELTLKIVDTSDNPLPIDRMAAMLRRVDLAGPLAPKEVTREVTDIETGRWEIAVTPRGGGYTAAIDGSSVVPGKPEGWVEFKLPARRDIAIKATVSPDSASIRGKVTAGAGRVVGGAPVFLRPINLPMEKRVADPRATRTSQSGEYQFAGLAPGRYRLMSSFEYASPDDAQMAAARAAEVAVAESEERVQDLELFAPR